MTRCHPTLAAALMTVLAAALMAGCYSDLREAAYTCTTDADCVSGYRCDAIQSACVPCGCDGRECGDDGCGQSCGLCEVSEICGAAGHCVFQSCADAWLTMATCGSATCLLDETTGPAITAPFCEDAITAAPCDYSSAVPSLLDLSTCTESLGGISVLFYECACPQGGTALVLDSYFLDDADALQLEQRLWSFTSCKLDVGGAMSGDVCWALSQDVFQNTLGAFSESLQVDGCKVQRDQCFLGDAVLWSYPLTDGTRCHIEFPDFAEMSFRVHAGNGIFDCDLDATTDTMTCTAELGGQVISWPAGCFGE